MYHGIFKWLKFTIKHSCNFHFQCWLLFFPGTIYYLNSVVKVTHHSSDWLIMMAQKKSMLLRFAVIVKIKNIPRREAKVKQPPKCKVWKTNKEGGWAKYKLLTTHNSALSNIPEDEDPEVIMSSIDKELTNVKYKCFGKVKYRNKAFSNNKYLENLCKEKSTCKDEAKIRSIEKEMAAEIENIRKNDREKELIKFQRLKSSKGKCAAIFHLRDSITGNKKVNQETTTVIDPKTKREVNSVDGIQKVSLEYCKDLLTKRAPKADFQNIIDSKISLHEERMSERITEEEFELTSKMFYDSLTRLTKKNPQKYKFILNGGNSLVNALFILYKQVWETEKIPSGWKNTDIVQIFKGKGLAEDLTGYRNIHMKTQERKAFGDIITHELKRKVTENIS